MGWCHSFLLIIGLVLLASVQSSEGTIVAGNKDQPHVPGARIRSRSCSCCENEEMLISMAYIKSLIMLLRSKMADIGRESFHYQKLDYLKSFEYEYLKYMSKFDQQPEPERK